MAQDNLFLDNLIAAEKDGNGVLKVSYTNGLNEVISRTEHDGETADTVFFLYDASCNVNAIVDEAGELVKTFDYDVFGALRTGSTPYGENKLQFAGGVGHPTDTDSGLIYMRARYYDPASGRFISEDPGRNGMNWYAYCGNNPVNAIDITGKTPVHVILAIIAAWFVFGALGGLEGYLVSNWMLGEDNTWAGAGEAMLNGAINGGGAFTFITAGAGAIISAFYRDYTDNGELDFPGCILMHRLAQEWGESMVVAGEADPVWPEG